ncbi:MAG: hypothetical protein JSW40_02095, partial [Candidatus Omnitrophota bacterium]
PTGVFFFVAPASLKLCVCEEIQASIISLGFFERAAFPEEGKKEVATKIAAIIIKIIAIQTIPITSSLTIHILLCL